MTQSKRKLSRELIEQGIFDKPWACWLWPYGKSSKGYGRAKIDGVYVPAHRHAYTYHVGPVPTGLLIDHVCHTKACFNPYHLRPVTNKQNMEYRNGLDANNTSGYRGVSYRRSKNTWRARVMHNGKNIECGEFNCPTKAGLAAESKRRELGFLGS